MLNTQYHPSTGLAFSFGLDDSVVERVKSAGQLAVFFLMQKVRKESMTAKM